MAKFRQMTEKKKRKLKAEEETRHRDMLVTVGMLNLADSVRVAKKVRRDMKRINYTAHLIPQETRRLFDYVRLTYQYAKQITDTVMI